MKKRYSKLLYRIIGIFLLFIIIGKILNIHIDPVNVLKSALKERNISIDESHSIKHDNTIYYICSNENKLISISVYRWGGVFWTVGNQIYKDIDNPMVYFDVQSDRDFSIVYGICDNQNIDLMQLILENNEVLNFNVEDKKIFTFIYNDKFLGWKKLIAYDQSNEIVWSYIN